MLANFILLFTAAIVAVMNIFLVARHTRSDEEIGRMEVIRSLPVGKLGNMTAAMLLALIANLIMTVVIGLGLAACGIEYINFTGSMTFAAALGSVGIFFAVVTSICCQLTANNRTAVGLSLAVTGGSYLLRGIGDSSDIPILTYTSPFGLAHITESYVSNYLWPVFVILGSSVLAAVLALYLGNIRDLGAGLLPARPGKKSASSMLSGSFGLTCRLLCGSALTWATVILVLCATLGSLFGDLETLVGDNTMMAAYFANAEFTIIEEFLTMLMVLISIIATVPSTSFLMKLRGEEKHGLSEHLLARSTSRTKMMAGNFILSLLYSVTLLVIGTLSLWAIAAATVEGVPGLFVMFAASFHYIPAIWVILGLNAALIGLIPKMSGIVFGYLGYCFIAMFTVMMFGLPEWIERLSPYAYMPRIPVEDANPIAAASLFGIFAVLSAIGFLSFRKRDAVFF